MTFRERGFGCGTQEGRLGFTEGGLNFDTQRGLSHGTEAKDSVIALCKGRTSRSCE